MHFRYVVFHPFLDEILVGQIKSCSQDGVHGKLQLLTLGTGEMQSSWVCWDLDSGWNNAFCGLVNGYYWPPVLLWCESDGSLSLAASPHLDGFVRPPLSFCPRITGKPIWSLDWIPLLASVNRVCFFQSGTIGLSVGLMYFSYSPVQICVHFLYLKTCQEMSLWAQSAARVTEYIIDKLPSFPLGVFHAREHCCSVIKLGQ